MFDKLIEECNEFICDVWKPGVIKHGSHQHRDLIRTFFAGAVTSLKLRGVAMSTHLLLEDMAPMVDINWWPDERFRVP